MALYTPSGNPVNASRGLASVLRAEFALIAAGIDAVAAEVLTLTNKTINLGSNTVTGTKAQFDAACSDGNFLYSGGTGDIGTPSAGVLTNCTGLPVGTGISGLGTGVASFLATPTSANFAAALTDESGSGSVPFMSTGAFSPVLTFATPGDLAVAYSTNYGEYVQIGKLLYYELSIITSAFVYTTSSGALKINTGILVSGASGGWNMSRGFYNGFALPSSRTEITLDNIAGSSQLALTARGPQMSGIALGTTNVASGSSISIFCCGKFRLA